MLGPLRRGVYNTYIVRANEEKFKIIGMIHVCIFFWKLTIRNSNIKVCFFCGTKMSDPLKSSKSVHVFYTVVLK